MYLIIQKIYEENKEILEEGLKNVFNGADVSSLTGAIKDFTDILGKELLTEIIGQVDKVIFDDKKRSQDYESIRFSEKSLITKNSKVKFERRYYKDKEKIKSRYVYIQVDEDHIKERNKDCTYKKEDIETIFIMGDGAQYIKAGLEWIEKSVFVLDKFHLEKYINHLNYDEYLKKKLQEAIDQYDPISTENIMNEAIKKINAEIKEDEKLGRNTKRLENRLKKIKDTKTYLLNQWTGIEAHEKYEKQLTGARDELYDELKNLWYQKVV